MRASSGPSDTQWNTSKFVKIWNDIIPKSIQWFRFTPFDIKNVKCKAMWEKAMKPKEMVAVIIPEAPIASFTLEEDYDVERTTLKHINQRMEDCVRICPSLLGNKEEIDDIYISGAGNRATHIRHLGKWWAVFGIVRRNKRKYTGKSTVREHIYDKVYVLHPFMKKTNTKFLDEQVEGTWARLEEAITSGTLDEYEVDEFGTEK